MKLITKTGMAVAVCSECVEPYDDKKEKQDCEINAFKRTAPALRKLMKKHPLCLVGDALYGCDSVRRICEGYGWKFILWCEEIRTYIRHFGCVMLVPRYRLMSRRHL